MEIADYLYGNFEVEQVVVELMESAPVQRLKEIHQGGASYIVNPSWNVNRYDHSVGVMLLIKKLGGSLEEQIAGLLHDISHTAFSHVIDMSLKLIDESYHEKIFEDIVLRSEIPKILKKYGINLSTILNGNWLLLDKKLPFLSVDRIDYTLRDMYEYGFITLDESHSFLKKLVLMDDQIVVTSLKSAEWFVEIYKREVIDFFYHPLNIYGYERLSSALNLALEKIL
ncbi:MULTISPECIES: HD domain-containing protein [Listeria]|uniref:HD domain-containing protein n=1 Tax=Listeria TaxID=1637 RepID=UPI001FC992E3|nr:MULTISPECIES: HD domain-containing protein [Listeria]